VAMPLISVRNNNNAFSHQWKIISFLVQLHY
jgi:hypothetical protein